MEHFRDNLKKAAKGAGFTLVEIALVIFIIGLMAAVIIPQIGVMGSVDLKSSTRKLAGTIRMTYNTSVLTKIPHRIVFDLEEHSYWVEEKSGDEYVVSGSEILEKKFLPPTVYFDKLRIMDRSCSSVCREYLYFTPGGYVEEAEIYLSDESGEMAFTVLTRPMVGKAAIVPGVITRDEWLKMEGEYERN